MITYSLPTARLKYIFGWLARHAAVVFVVLGVGLIGTILILTSRAATPPPASVQAENGTLSGPTTIGTDSNASGNKYVQFGSPANGSPNAPLAAMALDYGQQNYLGDTSRYQYVILQDSMSASVAAIHAANPDTKVLMYENAGFISNDCSDYPNIDSPMDTCQADADNQQWYLKQNGTAFAACDYPTHYWADIGNSSYQQTWLTDASSLAKADGFDGIFLDDTNTHPGHCEDGSLQAYTDTQYGNAMLGFLKTVDAGLKADGLLTVPNISANAWDASQESIEEAMAAYTSAVFQEMFMNYNLANPQLFSGSQWAAVMQQMVNVGKVTGYYANTYDSSFNSQTMLYGRASFLLGWNGGTTSAYQFHINNSDTTDSYNSVWAASIGTPTNSYYQLSDGVWRRDFTGGTVLVNPNASSSETVSLGGTYTNVVTNAVSSSVTLGPTSAAILSN